MKITKQISIRHIFQTVVVLLSGFIFFLIYVNPAFTAESDTAKIGFVTYSSGPAAEPFGIPARNAAEILVTAINNGTLPAPYKSKGIAGLKIKAQYIDEAGKRIVDKYKDLAIGNRVDVVIGYTSSSNCEAIAPIVEEIGCPTIFFDCGTPKIFEEIVVKPKYLFRTGAHATMDSVGAARYVLSTRTNATKIAGINQNYSWGLNSWNDFRESLKSINSSVSVVTALFPKLFADQYDSEISELLTRKPEVIHSSFWGGDMESFLLQASASGVFTNSTVILTTGESALQRLASQIPDGTVIGARGLHGPFAPDNELNRWFIRAYFNRFAMMPTYPSYKMAQALLGLKAAYDKTGKVNPNKDDIAGMLKGLEFDTPSGKVSMSISNGHQAIQDTAYGTYKYERNSIFPKLVNIKKYNAECVNPPDGVKSSDWIKSKFKDAQCE